MLWASTKLIGVSAWENMVTSLATKRYGENEIKGVFSMYMTDMEDEILESLLTKCDRDSMIAQEQDANEMGRKLQEKSLKNVNVGREAYSNISITIEIAGWTKPIFLKSIKIIKESGWWDWWPRWIQETKRFSFDKYANERKNIAPNMNGNILLVFLVLLNGLIISASLFLLETLKKVVDFLQAYALKCILYVYSSLNQIYRQYRLFLRYYWR